MTIKNYQKINNNEWILTVQQNATTKELYVEFPPGALDQAGWDIGDDIIWEELDNGSWRLTKNVESSSKA